MTGDRKILFPDKTTQIFCNIKYNMRKLENQSESSQVNLIMVYVDIVIQWSYQTCAIRIF